jgi:DNA-binding response OmpR family regulator
MKKYKTVIIDDHADTLELLAYNLEHEGYDVKKFSNAVDALKYINDENTDLILTDWMLPEMNGLASASGRIRAAAVMVATSTKSLGQMSSRTQPHKKV